MIHFLHFAKRNLRLRNLVLKLGIVPVQIGVMRRQPTGDYESTVTFGNQLLELSVQNR